MCITELDGRPLLGTVLRKRYKVQAVGMACLVRKRRIAAPGENW